MARISILTRGTRGDVQPLVAVAKGLAASGHSVVIGSNANFRNLVTDEGLEFAEIEPDSKSLLNSDAGQRMLDTGADPRRLLNMQYALLAENLDTILESCWLASEKSDLIIGGGIVSWGFDIAEKLDIPFVHAGFYPTYPTKEFSSIFAPEWMAHNPLTRFFSHVIVALEWWRKIQASINRWRQQVLGLPSRRLPPFMTKRWSNVVSLLGVSPSVFPTPSDWPQTVRPCGFWFLDSEQPYDPPAELLQFLDHGPAPLCIGFSSIPGLLPNTILDRVVSAVLELGLRAVLLSGWSEERTRNLPPEILQLPFVPHNWILPRVHAAVHHAGAGTTSAALRAGIPSLAIPFIADEPFWAHRLSELGVSPTHDWRIPSNHSELLEPLRQLMENPELQQNAHRISENIQAEDGVKTAVREIETVLEVP